MVSRCTLASFTKNNSLRIRFFLHVQSSHFYLILFFSILLRPALFSGPRTNNRNISLWNSRERRAQPSVTSSSNEKVEAVISVVLHGAGAHLFRSSTMSVNEQASTRWFMLMLIHVENEEERRRESPCDHSTWYINAYPVRVNSQHSKNVKCSSFMKTLRRN